MKRSVPVLLSVVIAALAAGTTARGDFVSWSYNFTPDSLLVQSDLPGTGGVTLTNEAPNGAFGTSDVLATNIRTFSSALGDVAGHFDRLTHASWGLTLTLTDDASGQSQTHHFTGELNGTLSGGGVLPNGHTVKGSANITSTAFNPLWNVTLGGNPFQVNLNAYTPPGPPTAFNAGSIGAHVIVGETSSGGGGGGNGNTPEPSTMILSCLGVAGLGIGRWLKRRVLA
jgi:hypothetical protein